MKLLKYIFALVVPVTLCSAGKGEYPMFSSSGEEPADKTYFVSSPDSAWVSTEDFKEYANALKIRLDELGYTEAPPDSAKVRIMLDYYIINALFDKDSNMLIKDPESAMIITGSMSGMNARISMSGTSKAASAYHRAGMAKRDSTDNAKHDESPSTFARTKAIRQIHNRDVLSKDLRWPMRLNIRALDNSSMEQIWEVAIEDRIKTDADLHALIPELLSKARLYFGNTRK